MEYGCANWAKHCAYVNLMDVGEFNGRRLHTGRRLNYRLRLWASTLASRAISAVDELLVFDTLTVLVLFYPFYLFFVFYLQ